MFRLVSWRLEVRFWSNALKAQVLMKFVIHFVSLFGKLITLSQMHHEVVLERTFEGLY